MTGTPLTCIWYGDVRWEDIPKDQNGRPVPGAMFYITFSSGKCDNHNPPCNKHLMVVCPDGHWWNIDSRASNCTEQCVNCGHEYHEHNEQHSFDCSNYEPRDGGAHHCWVRHGEVPNITVDKNGLTCKAGAGSILTPAWHGFLRNGELVT